MSCRRVKRHILAETVIPFAVKATSSVPQTKILLLGAFAALLGVVAVPILFRIDRPPAAAGSTLKCYDSDGKYEPCLARASVSPPPFDGRTAEAHQPPSWTTIALYQQANWPMTEFDEPAGWTTSAPMAQRGSTPGKRPASAVCRQRLIPCLFSALGRGLTHIATAAARGAGTIR
jgi:hypothetical protein